MIQMELLYNVFHFIQFTSGLDRNPSRGNMRNSTVSPIMEWTPEHSVGHDLLDSQHKKIMQVCAQIDQAIRNGVDDLQNYLYVLTISAEHHFKDEEKFLQQINYPYIDKQIQDHQNFAKRIALFNLQDSIGKLDRSALQSFLYDLCLDHIENEDIRFISYLKPAEAAE